MQPTYTGWQDLQTLQFKEIISELADAKDERRACLLISNTGLGKTNTIKVFTRKNDKNTYVLTVGDSYKLVDIIHELMSLLGIGLDAKSLDREFRGRRHMIHDKLNLIKQAVKDIAEKGGQPMIILDEAENLKPQVLKMIKELYDSVIDYCSIVLIGTEQILDSILNLKGKNRMSVPQLWRRFKAGARSISPLVKSRDFKPFFDKYIPGNLEVQDLLLEHCENYGELHDYLHPLLLHCSKKQKPLTAETFLFFHKIQAKKTLKRA